jgi:hypothetical protein
MHNSKGGRPKGLIRYNHVESGAYATPDHLGDILESWRHHNPCNAMRVDETIQRYLRQLGWTADHTRYNEVMNLVVLQTSRNMLLKKILDMDFTRNVRDPCTGNITRQRPADQFRRLEELDDEIQARLEKLGLLIKNGYNKGDHT